MADPVTVRTRLERKSPDLPIYAVVDAEAVAGWSLTGTTTVLVRADGHDAGRRSLKPWDAGRWFVEFRAALLAEAGLGPGDEVELTLALAPTELPTELRVLLARDPEARGRWAALSGARRRQIREHVLEARRADTRVRRARRSLGLDAP